MTAGIRGREAPPTGGVPGQPAAFWQVSRLVASAVLLLGAAVAGIWLLTIEKVYLLQPLIMASAALAGLSLHPWPRRGLIATALISLSWGEIALYVGASAGAAYLLWTLMPRFGMSGPRDGTGLLADAPLPAWAVALIIAIGVGIWHVAEFGIGYNWRV